MEMRYPGHIGDTRCCLRSVKRDPVMGVDEVCRMISNIVLQTPPKCTDQPEKNRARQGCGGLPTGTQISVGPIHASRRAIAIRRADDPSIRRPERNAAFRVRRPTAVVVV